MPDWFVKKNRQADTRQTQALVTAFFALFRRSSSARFFEIFFALHSFSAFAHLREVTIFAEMLCFLCFLKLVSFLHCFVLQDFF
ncbi:MULTISPECIES: hypothetical protein [Caproicibacterium]|uniref:Uncharacterized protein n=1 Tax=Caproicibacterium argilliputei TaxID=3030016 RepID=A0AA97DAQ5_9FIRM|nr:hypothetical protein [Caproicibacterium argilliputei]WOC32512.1 hypothetical protein PXC00_01190 [Caproicibacterium argilliputei]